MSYCRWSTDLKNTVPFKEQMKMYNEGASYQDIVKLQEERGAEISDWYIFWHVDSGEEIDDQCLAIWHVTTDGNATFSYPVVKEMYETDDWSLLGVREITQKEFMRSCVKEWLEDVENESI